MITRERTAPTVALPPMPQAVWGGLAVMNFTCGGAGAGAVLAILAVALVAPVSERAVRAAEVIGLLLAGIGFAAVGAEAGRPWRGLNVFRHLRRSWVSREALAAAALGIFIGLDVVAPGPWRRGLGAAAAFSFMLSQGFILFAAKGVPAWATWEMPLVFVTSGLAKGMGITLVVLAVLGEAEALRAGALLATGLILVAVLAWYAYSGSPDGSPAKQEALARLRAGWIGAEIVGLGYTAPLLALVAVLMMGGPRLAPSGWVVIPLAGLFMVAGGTILKWAVVRRAGMLHPLGLHVGRSVGRPQSTIFPPLSRGEGAGG